MTEISESFETLTGTSWAVRNPSAASYALTDRWESFDVETKYFTVPAIRGTNAIRKKESLTDFDDPIALALGESVQEFEFHFYMSLFWSGETAGPELWSEVLLDDGITGDGTPYHHDAPNLADNYFGVRAKYYHIDMSNSDHLLEIVYRKAGGAEQTVSLTTPSRTDWPLQLDEPFWVGIRVQVTSTEIKVYLDNNGSGIWVLWDTVSNSNYITNNLSNIVINPQTRSAIMAADEIVAMDFVRYASGSDVQNLDGVIQGITLGSAEIVSVESNWIGGGGGPASIVVIDRDFANYSTLESNIGKIVIIRDTVYNEKKFRGEIVAMNPLTNNLVELVAIDQIRKTTDQRCNHNPIQAAGTLFYVRDNQARNDGSSAPFSVFWDTLYGALSVEKSDLAKIVLHPYTINEISGLSPYAGDINALHFWSTSSIIKYNESIENWIVEFEFKVFLTDKDDVDNFDTYFSGYFPKNSGEYQGDLPKWQIYNYNSASWETLKTWTAAETDGGDGDPKFYTESVNIASNPANYFSYVAGPNSSGFSEHQLKIRWYTGEAVVSGSLTADFGFKFIMLTINTAINQNPGLGQGVIDASTTDTLLVLDNTTPSWGLTEFPHADGIGRGDIYYVTKFLDGIIDDVFLNANTDFLINHNVTGATDTVLFVRDLTDTKLHDFLVEIAQNLNAVFWLDENTTINLYSYDNLTDTGITLDRDDFVNFPDYLEDAAQLKDRVIVRGLYNTVTQTLTPEFELEGGIEEIIEVNESLVLSKSVEDTADALAVRHSKTKKTMSVELDYSNPNQSYQGISLYKKIGVQLQKTDGTNIKNFTTGNDGLMTITALKFIYDNSTGNERVILNMERIYT